SSWIESTFGVRRVEGSRLARAAPRGLAGESGAARVLAEATGVALERCIEALQEGLLAGYQAEVNPDTNAPPFAFRLHQFISRGDNVYASLEPEATRHITMQGQQFVPGRRDHVLLPMVFCRECGQEYYCVRMMGNRPGERRFAPRELPDRDQEDDDRAGYLYVNSDDPWPHDDPEALLDRVPEDWLEEHRDGPRIRRDRREYLPEVLLVRPSGQEGQDGLRCHFLRAPFRFCPQCRVSYGPRQRSDFGKLASLSSEGRSTATTVTSLFAVRGLRGAPGLDESARKLLSFTDNRQDAALQAGHFNDFVEIGQLRAGLYSAVAAAGARGLRHHELAQRVSEALKLPIDLYTGRTDLRFGARDEADEALREVLGYRLYHDLRRGWRVTAPNLEQCGLLEIRYPVLDDVCAAEDLWAGSHAALLGADPATRAAIAKVLLDFMRRELAIKVDSLDPRYQEGVRRMSSQYLVTPWAIDENETLERSTIVFPGSRAGRYREDEPFVYLSARGGFGQYLRRPTTFGMEYLHSLGGKLRMEDTDQIIRGLLAALHA
ncbi:MAG TPA: hypothetical protein VHB98_16535, partial [Chloroflexota bacterium]|nr:hypothetical protein [Chloroflexota bacterium]